MYNFHFGYLSRLYIRHFKTFIRVISVWVTFTFTKVIFSPDIVLYAVVHLLLLDWILLTPHTTGGYYWVLSDGCMTDLEDKDYFSYKYI